MQALKRQLGVPAAVMLGLGSILGTGVFVSMGIVAGVAGDGLLLSIFCASLLAACNGISSAQLAANHPVSGGTYEYGYRWLHPMLGFSAGWLFVCAKTASAATAALGFSGYLCSLFSVDTSSSYTLLRIAVGTVVIMTALVAGGIRRSSQLNIGIVSFTIISLLAFSWTGLAGGWNPPDAFPQGGLAFSAAGILEGTALMFVAYTGYGRIATLGEEVRSPAITIPKAIIATLVISLLLYGLVGAAALSSVGAHHFAGLTTTSVSPLVAIASEHYPNLALLIAIGACTAMLGVLLNLILGVSRVVLAMARRADLPIVLSVIRHSNGSPLAATIATGVLIATLVLIGDLKTTWSFSACTVLLYYGITNLAALRLSDSERSFPRWISIAGLVSCLFLSFWIELYVWCTAVALLAAGLVWHKLREPARQNVTEKEFLR